MKCRVIGALALAAIALCAGACVDAEQARAETDPRIVNKGELPSAEALAQVELEPENPDDEGTTGSSEAESDEPSDQSPEAAADETGEP